VRRLSAALALVLVPLATVSWAAPPLLEHLTDRGAAISLGFDVAPLRPFDLPPSTTIPQVEGDLQSTAISFDLKLTWPGVDVTRAFEPYLVLGPALFVVEPDYVGRMLGTRVDPALRLGGKAGAGLNWHLGKDATLFGAYEATSGSGPATKGAPDTGHDFTYGLRLRY
jgi:hypothetical protein